MGRHHIIQVSDLHLSGERGYNQTGWEACRRHVEEHRPDLVVVTGDLVLDDPDCADDHVFVRQQLDRLTVPWVVLPGNHDIGDTNPRPYMGQHLDAIRLGRYKAAFGEDHWSRALGDWLLIGLNSMLPGSGFPEEAEQFAWLRTVLAGAQDRPIALFLHKPLFINHRDEGDFPDVCVIESGRKALLGAFDGTNLKLVASGHNHHYRTFQSAEGIQMVWAPSTSQVYQTKRLFKALPHPGLVNHWLEDSGAVEFGLIRPEGMEIRDVTALIGAHRAMRYTPALPVAPLAAEISA